MEQYILPLFGAMASCLRFFLSREGKYWILPLAISLLLLLQNGSVLYTGTHVESPLSTGGLIATLISILWYAVIVIFRYALKRTIQQSDYRQRVRKDLTESQFILKTQEIETRRRLKKMRVLSQGSARNFDFGHYTSRWTDLFDKD